MKKFLVGCGLLFFVLGVASVVGGYFFVYKPVTSFLEVVQELSEWEKGIENTDPYSPPSDGEIPADRLDAFVRIQRANVARFGDRFEEFVSFARRLDETENGDTPNFAVFREVISEAGGFLRTYRDAREGFVAQLNEADFSWDEYTWIRGQFIAQMGAALSPDQLRALTQQGVPIPGLPAAEAPDRGTRGKTDPNAPPTQDHRIEPSAVQVPAFVLPYVEELPRWAALWVFEF